MKILNLHFKYTTYFILFFFSLNSQSQNTTKIDNYKIDTKNTILEKQNETVVIRRSLYIYDLIDLPESELERGPYKFNYKVDENGKITFIKGHLGFAKTEIPYELIGIRFPYYDDDKFINKLNTLITNTKIVHYIFSEKQPDCKKLKNVIFYGDFKIARALKKS